MFYFCAILVNISSIHTDPWQALIALIRWQCWLVCTLLVVMWYGMVGYDVIWYSVLWCDVVWYRMMWYGMVGYDVIGYSVLWCVVEWYRMMWYASFLLLKAVVSAVIVEGWQWTRWFECTVPCAFLSLSLIQSAVIQASLGFSEANQ